MDSEHVTNAVPQEASAKSRQRGLPPLLAKSGIQVIESTADRLVFFIPQNPARTWLVGLIALALLINAVLLFRWFVFSGDMLFLGFIWGCGLIFLIGWIQMRFGRTYICLEPSRLVVQRVLFGWRRVRETALGSASCARLVDVNTEPGGPPIFRFRVQGQNRNESFGEFLSSEERDWLVETINDFLSDSGIRAARDANSEFKYDQMMRHSGQVGSQTK